MNFKRISGLPLFLSICICNSYAQIENERETEVVIESVAGNLDENYDYSELQEHLEQYLKNPLDLNTASMEDLKEFIFLSPIQINNLLRHRLENGDFAELQELQTIDAFDPETISKLLPYITLKRRESLKDLRLNDLRRRSDNDLMFTYSQPLQKQQGYLLSDSAGHSHYEGNNVRFLTRYRYHFGKKLFAALTMEKDAGEKLFPGQTGLDFNSVTIFYKGEGRIRKLVLGDYLLQFGQGLGMWSGLSFGKGAAIASIAKQQSGLKAYTSTNEVQFLRGTAASVGFGKFEVTPFISTRRVDGSLSEEDSSGVAQSIVSLGQSGLHRTATEIENHNSIQQTVYGSNIQYSDNSFRAGAVVYKTGFNKEFQPGKYLYDQFGFTGSSITNVSFYYNYNLQNTYFFGEVAHTPGYGFAWSNGAMAALSKEVSAVILYRHYQKNFYSFFSQGVSEGSPGTAEDGLYTGLVISPDPKTEFLIYTDVFRFPWLKYGVDAPSRGYEALSQFSYSPRKSFKLTLRYKLKNKPENDDGNQTVHFLQDVQKQNFRVELNYKTGSFQLRSRVEAALYKKGQAREQGLLMYQDVIYKPMKSRVSGNLRLALFDTDGFNSRVYAFENDLLYSYSIPGYQNGGVRFYLNAKYGINRNTDLSARYAISSYTNCEEIGSGLDKINGRNKSDFKMQLRFQF
ncbi:ComEA family DNA-binding protein [Arcticibacter tournemirensis]